MELRGFWCGTGEFLGLKRCGPEVELIFELRSTLLEPLLSSRDQKAEK